MCTPLTLSQYAGWGAASYLLGAIPFGLLLSRLKGMDIRTVGSGNIGATNVFRAVSKPLGILTFILDMLKGWVPAWLFPLLAQRMASHATGPSPDLAALCACLAIAGHNWPLYLRFKGGKGVATSAGAVLGLAPLAVAIGLSVWVLVFLVTRYVSVASMIAAMAVVGAGWMIYPRHDWLLPVLLTALGLVIVVRHTSNLQRLRQGTEHQFQFGRRRQS